MKPRTGGKGSVWRSVPAAWVLEVQDEWALFLSRLNPVGGRCVAQTGRTSPLLSMTWRGIGRERIRTWRSTTTRRPASCVTGRFRRGSGYVNLRRGIRPRSVVRCPFLAQVVSWNPDQNCTPNWSWPRAGVHRIPWQQGRYPEVSGFRPEPHTDYPTPLRVTRPEEAGGPLPADLEPRRRSGGRN